MGTTRIQLLRIRMYSKTSGVSTVLSWTPDLKCISVFVVNVHVLNNVNLLGKMTRLVILFYRKE